MSPTDLIKSDGGFYAVTFDIFICDPVFIKRDPTFLFVTRTY